MKSSVESANMDEFLDVAKSVITAESQAVSGLIDLIDGEFCKALQKILTSPGKVVVSGMGKSGIIGKKIAATLASTGTESFFMHPGEAYHGDLGMISRNDTFLAISNSGETDEVVKLIPFLADNGNFTISFTGNPESTLAQASDAHVNVFVEAEACPLQLAPTSSTTAALVMGDALAITLMRARNFQPENFARFHPGGSLGKKLLQKVGDVMSVNFPIVQADTSFLDVLHAISSGMLGVVVVNFADEHYGLITDGDIRRTIEEQGSNVFSITAYNMMTRAPVSVENGTSMHNALELMEHHSVSCLLVKRDRKVVGILKK